MTRNPPRADGLADAPGLAAWRLVRLGVLAALTCGAALPPGHSTLGHSTLGDSVLPRAVTPAARRAWMARQSGLCLTAIEEAGAQHGLPPGLLAAVARVETGRPLPVTGDRQPWPWSINADGESLFFDTRAAAAAETTRRLAQGARYVDIGCAQVDLRMHPTAFATLADAFNPALNAAYAASLLADLHAAGHGWTQAAGLYHSATPGVMEPYRDDVDRMRKTQKPMLAK